MLSEAEKERRIYIPLKLNRFRFYNLFHRTSRHIYIPLKLNRFAVFDINYY